MLRSTLLILLIATATAAADPPREALPPLAQLELHVGYGLAMSGSGARMSKRATPLTLTAVAAYAFESEPPLWGYGGLVVETLDRSAAGAVAGVKYTPRGSRLHFAGGGSALLAPRSLFGVTASGGYCRPQGKTLGICGDLQVTSYLAGDDLAEGRAVTQVQLVLGAVLDVL